MYLSDAKRYYAFNDRATNLLIKCDVDMSTTTGEDGETLPRDGDGFSDVEVMEIAKTET